MSRKIFGVIGAMDIEIASLQACIEHCKTEQFAGLTFFCGSLGENEIVLVKCGVGKVSAARCAQALIDRYHPDYLLNTGVAGGLGDGLHVGDFVIGAELVQHDFDLTKFGYPKGVVPGFGDGKSPFRFQADTGLVDAFFGSALQYLSGENVRKGCIASGDVFVADAEMKGQIKQLFSADAVEMEGAAIAQVAVANGVPFVVVRAISDLADGTAAGSFRTFEEETANLAAQLVKTCVKSCR